MDKIKAGIAISKLRKAVNLTQREVAEKLNIRENYMSDIETGKRGLTLNLIEKLAVFYKCDLSLIIYLLDKKENDEYYELIFETMLINYKDQT